MPLDNAKLAEAVNTTEKLVKRMDTYYDRRKDMTEQEREEAIKRHGEVHENKIAGQKRARESSDNRKKQRGLNAAVNRMSERKDDYGHPVKSNNRVQQTDYGQEADNKKSVDARRGQEDV